MGLYSFRELFLWFLETFRPRPRTLHPVVISDMDDLRRRDLRITARRFRGHWIGQQELHCLRAELRRRALQELGRLLCLSAKQFLTVAYWKGRSLDKPKASTVSRLPPTEPPAG